VHACRAGAVHALGAFRRAPSACARGVLHAALAIVLAGVFALLPVCA
jgi:hypothetical protein